MASAHMLIERWHPVTSDFGLIEAPLEKVVGALLDWHQSIQIHHRKTDIDTGLETSLAALLPLSSARQRQLLLQTDSTWTAFFQNGIQGSDPFPAMSVLAENLRVLSMRVCAAPPKAIWPATVWEVYAPPTLGGRPPLGIRRIVTAMKDGGKWIFEQQGEPFDFEDLTAYSAARKKDRFTVSLLRKYLSHFDIRLFEDDFFMIDSLHPAVLLQQTYPQVRQPEFTLQEVLEGKPWLQDI